MFEGGRWCIVGFEGWRELIPNEAGPNRVVIVYIVYIYILYILTKIGLIFY